MKNQCAICGAGRDLDRHHVRPRRMGGSRDPGVLSEENLVIVCRRCHTNLHEGRWTVTVSGEGLFVEDAITGELVMRRLTNPDIDRPMLFQLLNLTADSYARVLDALPFLSDEELIEAFGYARSFGKQSWLVQAAVLHEAQARSIYGDQALAAVARRFDISLRQAEKYAAVWQTFFAMQEGAQENVNIDEIVLEEPSWYVVAASETKDPHTWLAYAQDRKLEDPRYTVAALRRDIRAARLHESIGQARTAQGSTPGHELDRWACPWVRIYCTRTGRPLSLDACDGCAEPAQQQCETKPI
jgi:hypothetical protein